MKKYYTKSISIGKNFEINKDTYETIDSILKDPNNISKSNIIALKNGTFRVSDLSIWIEDVNEPEKFYESKYSKMTNSKLVFEDYQILMKLFFEINKTWKSGLLNNSYNVPIKYKKFSRFHEYLISKSKNGNISNGYEMIKLYIYNTLDIRDLIVDDKQYDTYIEDVANKFKKITMSYFTFIENMGKNEI